jgi:hypothetical protein
MCDYSLMALPNRLAVCGEELLVHRFEMGSMGLASASDIHLMPQPDDRPAATFWEKLQAWFFPPVPQQCPAVCIPPGARLLVRDIPEKLQKSLRLESGVQEVVFTQIGTAGFRDAIRFPNGAELLLQRLTEGQRVRVLALSSEDEHVEPTGELERVVRPEIAV